MDLFIVRHGDASFNATTDVQRPLTDQGKGELETLAVWLKQANLAFDLVLVSPYLRSKQSWYVLRDNGVTAATEQEIAEISPESDPELAASVIQAYGTGKNSVLVISHLPLVSYLVGQFSIDSSMPLFATGAVAHIQLEDNVSKGPVKSFIAPFEMA